MAITFPVNEKTLEIILQRLQEEYRGINVRTDQCRNSPYRTGWLDRYELLLESLTTHNSIISPKSLGSLFNQSSYDEFAHSYVLNLSMLDYIKRRATCKSINSQTIKQIDQLSKNFCYILHEFIRRKLYFLGVLAIASDNSCVHCCLISDYHRCCSIVYRIRNFFQFLTERKAIENNDITKFELFGSWPFHGNNNNINININHKVKQNAIRLYCQNNPEQENHIYFTLTQNLGTLLLVLWRNGKTNKLYQLCTMMMNKLYYYSTANVEKFTNQNHTCVLDMLVGFGISNVRDISPQKSLACWKQMCHIFNVIKLHPTEKANYGGMYKGAKQRNTWNDWMLNQECLISPFGSHSKVACLVFSKKYGSMKIFDFL